MWENMWNGPLTASSIPPLNDLSQCSPFTGMWSVVREPGQAGPAAMPTRGAPAQQQCSRRHPEVHGWSAVPGAALRTCKWHAGVSGLPGSGGGSEGEL